MLHTNMVSSEIAPPLSELRLQLPIYVFRRRFIPAVELTHAECFLSLPEEIDLVMDAIALSSQSTCDLLSC